MEPLDGPKPIGHLLKQWYKAKHLVFMYLVI